MASTALDLSDPYLFSKLLADHQSFENKKLLNRFVCIGDATVPYPATESQSEEPKIKIHSSRIEFVDRDLFKPAIAHEWDRGSRLTQVLIRGVCKVIYRIRVDKRLRLIKENYQKQVLIDKGLVKYETTPIKVVFPDSFIQPNRTVAYKKAIKNNESQIPVEMAMNSYKTYRATNVAPAQLRNTYVPFTLPTQAEFALSVPLGQRSIPTQCIIGDVEDRRFFNREIQASSRVEAFTNPAIKAPVSFIKPNVYNKNSISDMSTRQDVPATLEKMAQESNRICAEMAVTLLK